MDEMEIISLHKRCNKRAGRFHSLKRHQSHPNQMNLKKYQGHQGLLIIQARKDRRLKKHQGQAMEKIPLQRQEKKLKRPHNLKKHQSHLNLLTQVRKRGRGRPKMIKRKKIPPLLGVKEEVQSFYDLQKNSKNLTIEKKVEKVVLWRDLMKVTNYHMLHYVIPNTLKGC